MDFKDAGRRSREILPAFAREQQPTKARSSRREWVPGLSSAKKFSNTSIGCIFASLAHDSVWQGTARKAGQVRLRPST